MIRSGLRLPSVVFLRPATMIDNREMAKALGEPSRQAVYQWRKRLGFPAVADRSGSLAMVRTRDLAAWLAARNVRVEWT